MGKERRDFIRTVAGAGLFGLVGAGPLRGRPLQPEKGSAPAAAGDWPDLVTVRGGSPMRLVKTALENLGGMGRFVSKGDKVVLKPNIGWDRIPEQGANTNPQVVASLIKHCKEAGAASVTVLDNTCNDQRRCYARSGIEGVCREEGAELRPLVPRDYVEVDMKGEVIGRWMVARPVLEADCLINVPVAKHHSLTQLSLGMKNWFGAVGGRRQHLHQNISTTIADMAAYFQPRLVVVDAVRILKRNGPQGGNVKDVEQINTLVASTDQVAADAAAAGLFGLEPASLDFIVKAHQRGLGRMSPEGARWETVTL